MAIKTKEEAWKASEQGVVVDMKLLTGSNVDVERVDVDELLTKEPDTFNLMLLAIEAMQRDNSRVGWFQLSGIHGHPTALWDSVGGKKTQTWDNNTKIFGGEVGGYCAHGVLTFGPWHRPYLALLEQTIYRNMVIQAGKYTDATVKKRYLAAAQKFRLPYLDYFRPRGPGFVIDSEKIQSSRIKKHNAQLLQRRRDGSVVEVPFRDIKPGEPGEFKYDFRLPDIFMKENVTLYRPPNNEPTPRSHNPLYTYKFNTAPGDSLKSQDLERLAKFKSTEMTIRCPDLRDGMRQTAREHGVEQLRYNLNWTAEDNVAVLLSIMNDPPYQRFAAVGSDELVGLPKDRTKPRGADFTETQDKGRGRPSGSLEGSIHNAYHGLIGLGGHMDNPSYAAFDPVFYFHHCNIDRYFALWQAANPINREFPERWFPIPDKTRDPKATYDGDKPLYPFYKERTGEGKGTYWTSDDVIQTQVLGYVYDDFARIEAGQKPGDYMRSRYDFATRRPDSKHLGGPPFELLFDKVRESPILLPPKPATPSSSGGGGGKVTKSARMASSAPEVALTAAPEPLNPIEPIFDREWYVDSRVQRMAANGTFTIYFFLSPKGVLPDDEPSQYAYSPYLVGMHHVFTASRETCHNCGDAEAAGKLSVDTTPLTASLLYYREEVEGNGLDSLRPEHVKPYLQERLRWRVVFEDFDLKDPRIPELQLQIGVSAKVYHNDADPTYEEYPDVVDSILAGASAAPSAVSSA